MIKLIFIKNVYGNNNMIANTIFNINNPHESDYNFTFLYTISIYDIIRLSNIIQVK